MFEENYTKFTTLLPLAHLSPGGISEGTGIESQDIEAKEAILL